MICLLHLWLQTSLLILLQLLGLTGWLDNAEQTPMLMSTVKVASLFCAASVVLYRLSLKKNPVALVPEVWINAVVATALLANVELAFQVLMLGTIFMSLVTGIISHMKGNRSDATVYSYSSALGVS
jgi:hypothetical protein